MDNREIFRYLSAFVFAVILCEIFNICPVKVANRVIEILLFKMKKHTICAQDIPRNMI